MKDRLLIGVLGNRHCGKSHTWNTLFGRPVRRGKTARHLELAPGECVEVFVVSGSFEERGEYAGDVLDTQDCRIVLCSLQYTEDVRETINYLIAQEFELYIQWINPGFNDAGRVPDGLNLVDEILSQHSTFSVRDGRVPATGRVQELRQFIYGWAKYRGLILPC